MKGDGSVWCWGSNAQGQLGREGGVAPAPVVGLTGAMAQIAAGAGHTCAFRDDGRAWCWGANLYGQLGNGATSQAPIAQPARVAWQRQAQP
jgi:alpha-tubulin suppressor-like RCC1 family protein